MDRGPIVWRLRLRNPPEVVYSYLSTEEGMRAFLAPQARRTGDRVELTFASGERWEGRVIHERPPHHFEMEYLGGRVVFLLHGDGLGGTDLELRQEEVHPDAWAENRAGWVSVLLLLKAQVDHAIDLRNGDPTRSWEAGYVDQ
ncbi:MAG TPA: hypothetical protein VNZ52_01740 [Candidatus Thermoplasmatota archaeon]|nr:hypothetical protein [Candidatus Thermoplasmatota archaeon]